MWVIGTRLSILGDCVMSRLIMNLWEEVYWSAKIDSVDDLFCKTGPCSPDFDQEVVPSRFRDRDIVDFVFLLVLLKTLSCFAIPLGNEAADLHELGGFRCLRD